MCLSDKLFVVGDLLSAELAVRLSCGGQLAVVMQQNVKQRAIVNMQLVSASSLVIGKILVEGLRAAHWQYRQRVEAEKNS